MHMTTAGIVLRAVPYKESDQILTVLTRDAGKITVSARGSRKKGNGLSAASQLLCYADMTLSQYQSRWTLGEAEVIREFRGVRQDLEKLALGSWFAELTECLAPEELPAPELLRLLLNGLYALDATEKDPVLVKAAFELKAMCYAGYEPLLDGCAVCGREPEAPQFHLSQGVLHCASCRGQLPGGISMPLGTDTLAALRHVVYGGEKRFLAFRLTGPALEQFAQVCEAFVLTQLERGFRTLDFYKQIAAMGR